jgi:hypothetical protein
MEVSCCLSLVHQAGTAAQSEYERITHDKLDLKAYRLRKC